MTRERAEVQIVCCPGGPMLVRGATQLVDDHGVVHPLTRPVVAVCRCGKSSRQPWCDGTHKLVGPRREPAPEGEAGSRRRSANDVSS